MSISKPAGITHGIELFEDPQERVKGYRGSDLVGYVVLADDGNWYVFRPGSLPAGPVSKHAGIALLVGGCPGCICDPYACEHDDTGGHCEDMSCGSCLHGCPEGECDVTIVAKP